MMWVQMLMKPLLLLPVALHLYNQAERTQVYSVNLVHLKSKVVALILLQQTVRYNTFSVKN